jgi:hypothetical protein
MDREEFKLYVWEIAAMPDPQQQKGALSLYMGSLTPEEQGEIPDIARELVAEAVAQIAASLRPGRS